MFLISSDASITEHAPPMIGMQPNELWVVLLQKFNMEN